MVGFITPGANILGALRVKEQLELKFPSWEIEIFRPLSLEETWFEFKHKNLQLAEGNIIVANEMLEDTMACVEYIATHVIEQYRQWYPALMIFD